MPPRALSLGLLITVIWGLNFSLIKTAEDVFHPFLLATLRFVLTAIPAIFFFPRPKVPFRYLTLYGIVFGVLQFSLLFGGIWAGLSAGLSSVVLQTQVFFTILFSVLLVQEKIKAHQAAGIILGFVGVALTATVTDGSMTVLGLLMVVGAGLSWGLANAIVKKVKPEEPVGFMVWSSTVPVLPLIVLCLIFEGPASIGHSFASISWAAAGSVLYVVYPTTLFGYSVWNGLLKRYPTTIVAPLTLLVPLFGMVGSMLIFHEHLTIMKVVAAAMMILGLGVNQFGGRFIRNRRLEAVPAAPVGPVVTEPTTSEGLP